VLARHRDTLPQWQLSPIERRRNIKGAFIVTQPELVQGKTVLLVDDILTTGFTLAECARTLRKAGAKEVYGLALASGAAGW
jgi:predicted amidophosphoribosyltransferase